MSLIPVPVVKVIIGQKGAYLCYYSGDGFAHVRLLGDPNPKCEVWADVKASHDSWLFILLLVIQNWENAVTLSFMAVFPSRQGAWNIATSDEAKRDCAYVYSEWLSDGMWHVATYFPKARA